MTTVITLDVRAEAWPLAEPFIISRGTKTEARVVVVTAHAGGFIGRGECVPYARYDETVDGVVAAIRTLPPIRDRTHLQEVLAPGAARNAVDCALWDLEAKQTGTPACAQAGLPPAQPLLTAYTLSLASPEAMALKAAQVPHLPLLKLKLGGTGDDRRMKAVRAARPDARLIADANEAWTEDDLALYLAAAAEARFEVIEQPLAAGKDEALSSMARAVPVCADESVHTSRDLAALPGRYDAVNIKLDKAGGLTEALRMARDARRQGLRIMAGSMVATSLSMAPAFLLAGLADWVDLDSPLLLARDRPCGFTIRDGLIAPHARELWG